MSTFFEKYMKYKKKYIELKNKQRGGDNNLQFFCLYPEIIIRHDAYFPNTDAICTLMNNGASGFVYSCTMALVEGYENARPKLIDAAIKGTIYNTAPPTNPDNFYREFIAGTLINEFRKYSPNWCHTFGYAAFKTPEMCRQLCTYAKARTPIHQNQLIESLEPIMYATDPVRFSPDSFKRGCATSRYSAILLENVSNSISMEKFMTEHFNQVEFINLLFQLYAALVSKAGKFTHNDFHTGNLLIRVLPAPVKIVYTDCLIFNGFGERDVILYTRYIPVIIDYGRAYVYENKISTKTIPDIVCDIRECNPSKSKIHGACDATGVGYVDVNRTIFGINRPTTYSTIDMNSFNGTMDLMFVNRVNLHVQKLFSEGKYTPGNASLLLELTEQYMKMTSHLVWPNGTETTFISDQGIMLVGDKIEGRINNIFDYLILLRLFLLRMYGLGMVIKYIQNL